MGHDPWSDPASATPSDLERMAAQLEDRARLPDQVQVNTLLLDVLAARPGERLLEVGSGTGLLCRQLAPAVAPGGRVVGIDLSPAMAMTARRLAAGRPGRRESECRLQFTVARAEALPFPGRTFEAAFAARLLLHVPDAPAVVREMARVVAPGGRVVLLDWDWETVAVDHPNRELTRRILHWRCDHRGIDNWRGRQLLGLARAAGLADVEVRVSAVLARTEDSALTLSLWHSADNARAAGAITGAEHASWTAGLRQSLAEDRFCASIVYFVVRGEVLRDEVLHSEVVRDFPCEECV
jgi:ubiquinone/menaquinone biosynthesis C-methylase UbiE